MSGEMAKYRLKIVFENKDVEETEVRFDDILNSKDAVCKVLSSKCCRIKGMREKINYIDSEATFIDEVSAGAYIYEIEKLS